MMSEAGRLIPSLAKESASPLALRLTWMKEALTIEANRKTSLATLSNP